MSDAATVGGVAAARSLRDLTAQEAAPSEEGEDSHARRQVEALWESGLMQWANPKAAGGQRAEPDRDDRHLDRTGLAGRVGRMGRDRQLPLCRGLRRLPP